MLVSEFLIFFFFFQKSFSFPVVKILPRAKLARKKAAPYPLGILENSKIPPRCDSFGEGRRLRDESKRFQIADFREGWDGVKARET